MGIHSAAGSLLTAAATLVAAGIPLTSSCLEKVEDRFIPSASVVAREVVEKFVCSDIMIFERRWT